ncbi:glycosyltransferase family 4 protein [Euryarchaeota archaeon]|nr:glycosyltransferase family 4 protein [Euryarchaeota archaeon]
MNFFSRRKFGKNSNRIVRLAITHCDRPTDLKNAFLSLDLGSAEVEKQISEAFKIFHKHPAIRDDIRLAHLRAVCGSKPSNYATMISKYPDLLNDSRANSSIEFYKNRTLDEFLGIKDDAEEEMVTNIVYTFDDTMFEHIDYTQFETKLDDDFGLIEYANSRGRTLNQLRDRIQNLILTEGMDRINILVQEIQHYLIKYEYSKRATTDFFVASLRAMGDIDSDAGVNYGMKFLGTILDHRGMRSMVIFLRRNGDYLDALKILHHPKFKHDIKTAEWVKELTDLHKEMLLDGKLKPKFDEFSTNWNLLEEYMDTLYSSMDEDIEIARYNYGYALRTHKTSTDRPLAASVIKWGFVLLDAATTFSDTVSIHVSNAYINLGEISKAIEVLKNYGNPNSARISSKIHGYHDLLDLKNKGTEFDLNHYSETFDPIPERVLYVLHNSLPYNSGGYATRGHGLMCGVKKLGWDVQVVTRRGYPHDRKGMEGLPTDILQLIDDIPYHRLIELEKGYGQINIAGYLQAYAEDLARLVQELRPSILHAASNHINGLVVNAVAKHFNIPSIYEVRGLWEITRISRQPEFEGSEYFQMMSSLEARSASDANYVFAITHALADEMKKRSDNITEVGFLPNGVHSERFIPVEANLGLKDKLGINHDAVVLGYIGSLVSYEGLDLLLESLPLIKKEVTKPFKVMIVGDGAYMETLQTLCSKLELDDDVIFTGRIPHEEVEEYYSIVDIAPFPRLPLPVTEMVSPLKPFEAMAMQKAVISSNVAALGEIVFHQETGVLFEKGDVDDLALNMSKLIEDSELRHQLGIKAREWVCSHRDWNIVSDTLDNTYHQLLN